MFKPAGSTSWPRRHWKTFERLAPLMDQFATQPRVIIVGPGGVTRLMARWLPHQTAVRPSRIRRTLRNLPRVFDQCLRRVPFLPLVSLEPGELIQILNRPFELVVVDISSRILNAIKKDFPQAKCFQLDLAKTSIPVMGHVVIAYGVITRTSDPPAAMVHVIEATQPGGLLVTDDRSAQNWLPGPPFFKVVDEQIYQRSKYGES